MNYFDIENLPKDLHKLLYHELLSNPFIGINITDANGYIIFLNETHSKITGQSKEEYVGRTMYEIEKNKLVSESATIKVLKTGKPVLLNQKVPNGRIFQVKGLPIKDKQGIIRYVLNYLIDVSELVRVKEKMEEIVAVKEKLENKYEELQQTLNNNRKLIYQSHALEQIIDRAIKVAETDVTVLITGPSGCGKEHIANIIQQESQRKEKPFIKINCAAIPEHLLESELFGYVAGAFTGGNPKGKKGLLEEADKGTLLLDEIGELPMPLQSKLLRVLQEREIRRIGGNKTIHVDFRLITSTNANLKEMILEKKFREDLYYRLDVVEIEIPGLEQRREDIPLLIEHFIQVFNSKHSRNKTIQKDALHYLTTINYPGNVRELQNIIERIIIQSEGDKITLQDAYEGVGLLKINLNGNDTLLPVNTTSSQSLKEMVAEYEKKLLIEYLKIYGNGSLVAKKLKTDQSTISRKISKYKINM